MTAMTLISRVLGLVREQVRAGFLGIGAASDAFGVATMIPNLLRRLFAEGAMTAAFIPVLTEYLRRGDEEALRQFLSRFVTLLMVLVTGVSIFGVLVSPWLIGTFYADYESVPGKAPLTIILTQVMWPYLMFITFAAVLQAVLNAHKIFGPSAFTPVLLNLAIIGCAFGLSHLFPDPSYALVVGFLVGGILQIAFQVPYLFKHTRVRWGIDFGFRKDAGVRRVFRIMGPGVFAAGIYQINVFASQVIAAGLYDGAVASLQFSVRLQELVLGLFVASIAQVILPSLSEHTADGDDAAVKNTLSYATRLIAFVTLPATAGLILLGPEIIRLLFQFDAFDAAATQSTAFALQFHAMGLLFIGQARIYQQVYFAYKDLKTPTLVSAVVAVVNIVLCLVLAEPLGHGGVALAGSLAAVLNMGLYVWLLRKKLGGLGLPALLSRVGRLVLSTGAMVGGLIGFAALWPSADVAGRGLLFVWVLAALGVAAASYLGLATALRVNEFGGLLQSVRRKFSRRARRD
ncbi:MAG: putative peptidoglycan lipid II flippase [Myxococcota bacterium]|jgi:putative peptidoglycan lipid II flippase